MLHVAFIRVSFFNIQIVNYHPVACNIFQSQGSYITCERTEHKHNYEINDNITTNRTVINNNDDAENKDDQNNYNHNDNDHNNTDDYNDSRIIRFKTTAI